MRVDEKERPPFPPCESRVKVPPSSKRGGPFLLSPRRNGREDGGLRIADAKRHIGDKRKE